MQQPRSFVAVRPRFLFLLTAITLSSMLSSACHASNGVNSTTLPQSRTGRPVFSKQSGLAIQVDTAWTGNYGYRPVKVTVSAAKPVTADTLLTINFRAGSYRNNYRSISVEQDFELPQGATSVTTVFPVPQYVRWDLVGWDLWVDGAKDDQLCMNRAGFSRGNTNNVSAGTFLLGSNRRPILVNTLNLAVNTNPVDVHDLKISDLPTRWIDYSSFDLFVTTIESLERLQVSEPEKLQAILRWLRTGGNLWIIEAGREYSELARLEKLLAEESVESEPRDTKDPLAAWKPLSLRPGNNPRVESLLRLTMDGTLDEESSNIRRNLDSRDPDRAANSRRWFLARAYGYGTVLAMHGNDWGNAAQVTALQRSTIGDSLPWGLRHGNNPASGNSSFNNLLIPDVGVAPVLEFQLLISLFFIAIGPVNYWLLKRRNQLPLMVVTVPLAALAATVVLFGYGTLADGIGAQVRVRSMTLLDQRAGEVSTCAWQSYYAGIAPSDGMQLPDDTAIYPVHPAASGMGSLGRRRINQQRSLKWEEAQSLTRGWLASRTPTQYLTLTSRGTKKRLQFDSGEEALTVNNLLETPVETLIVQDHAGKFFVGEQIEANGTAKLKPIKHAEALAKIRQLITENLPMPPAGYVQSNAAAYRYGGGYDVSMTDSLMELQFETVVSPVAKGWGNGSYLAVTTAGVAAPLGLDFLTESGSFHVVRGTW